MTLLRLDLQDVVLNPLNCLTRFHLMLKAECTAKDFNLDEVAVHINMEDLYHLIHHPYCRGYGIAGIEGILGFNCKVFKGTKEGYIAAFCKGVALDTHIFVYK